MVSEERPKQLWRGIVAVLILVVVEDGLRVDGISPHRRRKTVLILVVVEDGLRVLLH